MCQILCLDCTVMSCTQWSQCCLIHGMGAARRNVTLREVSGPQSTRSLPFGLWVEMHPSMALFR